MDRNTVWYIGIVLQNCRYAILDRLLNIWIAQIKCTKYASSSAFLQNWRSNKRFRHLLYEEHVIILHIIPTQCREKCNILVSNTYTLSKIWDTISVSCRLQRFRKCVHSKNLHHIQNTENIINFLPTLQQIMIINNHHHLHGMKNFKIKLGKSCLQGRFWWMFIFLNISTLCRPLVIVSIICIWCEGSEGLQLPKCCIFLATQKVLSEFWTQCKNARV